MSNGISKKIDEYTRANIKNLRASEAKSGRKFTKYDIAQMMLSQGKLSKNDFAAWMNTREGYDNFSLTNQQKQALKNGSIWGINNGMSLTEKDKESYLDGFGRDEYIKEPITGVKLRKNPVKPRSASSSAMKRDAETRSKVIDTLLSNAQKALSMLENYHRGIGYISADAFVQGMNVIGSSTWDNVTGRNDFVTVFENEDSIKNEINTLKILKSKVNKPMEFEREFKKLYGVNFNAQKFEKLADVSSKMNEMNVYENLSEYFSYGIKELEKSDTSGFKPSALLAPLFKNNMMEAQTFIENLKKNCSSDAELKEKLIEVLKESKSDADNKLKSYNHSQIVKEYKAAYKGAMGSYKSDEVIEKYIQIQKMNAMGTEVAGTVALALLTSGSSAVLKTGSKVVSKLGAKLGGQVMKAGMTASMAAVPAAETIVGGLTSKEGLTVETGEEAWEELKTGLMYGAFGAYVSGPLGNVVSKVLSKNPQIFKSILSSHKFSIGAGAVAETSADVLFDRITSDLSFKESLAQNGIMNFGMMFVGARINKGMQLPDADLSQIKIEKMRDGSFNLKANGKVFFKAKNADELAVATLVLGVKEATAENPAQNVTPRFENEVYKNEFKDEGMRLNTPEKLENELRAAEVNPKAPAENTEALAMVASGKTKQLMTQRYSEMAKILDEIHTKYAKEIRQMEAQYGKEPQLFAGHFMKFLAEKMDVAGCEPNIKFVKTEGDGAYDWKTGTLYLSDELKNTGDIKTMIAHEFIHTLQFRNILATYGRDGVVELYMKHNGGKAIDELTRKYVKDEYGAELEDLGLSNAEVTELQRQVAEAYADRCLSYEANARLLKHAQENPVEKGSVDSYMARLQLDNLIKPEEFDTEAYYRSTNETEAYFLGSGQITGRSSKGETIQKTSGSRSESEAGMTASMAAVPAAETIVGGLTSKEGLTAEKGEEAWEELKNGLMYGAFGAYVSGPLGNVVSKVLSKNPQIFSQIVASQKFSMSAGAAMETTADVLFDRITSDMSFKESMAQNGIMNFGMMFVGARMNKGAKLPDVDMSQVKIEKMRDGSFNLKANGRVFFKAKNENELALVTLALGAKNKTKSEVKTDRGSDNYQINYINKPDEGILLSPTKIELLRRLGLDDNDIGRVDLEGSETRKLINTLKLLQEEKPQNFAEITREDVLSAFDDLKYGLRNDEIFGLEYWIALEERKNLPTTFDELLAKAPKKYMSEQEADLCLEEEFGLNKEQISEVKRNAKEHYEKFVTALRTTQLEMDVMGEANIENILQMAENLSAEEISVLDVYNSSTINYLAQKLNFSPEEIIDLYEDIFFNADKKAAFDKYYELSKKSNISIRCLYESGSRVEDNMELLEKITPEQLKACKRICDGLNIDNTCLIENAVKIKDTSQITAEFINEFKNVYNKFLELGIAPNYIGCDPVEHLAKLKNIETKIKENNFDFGWYKQHGKISLNIVEKLVTSENAAKSSRFLNLCSVNLKNQQSSVLLRFASNPECLENIEDFAKMLNTFAIIPGGNRIFCGLEDVMKQNSQYIDIKGITDVAEAFAEVSAFPIDSGPYAFFAKDYMTNTPNYKGMAQFIRELNEYYKDSEYSIQTFMKDVWRGGYYDKMQDRFKQLKELNLYGKIDPHEMRMLLECANDDAAFNKVVRFHNNPLINGYILSHYHDIPDEILAKRLENVKNTIIKMNPEYTNLSEEELCTLVRKLGAQIYYAIKSNFNCIPAEGAFSIDKITGVASKFALELFNDTEIGLDVKTKADMFNYMKNNHTPLEHYRKLRDSILGKNKEYILKQIEMRCKNTTPKFADWVKNAMNSEEIFKFLNLPNLNRDKIVNDLFETSKILRYVNQKPQDYINGQYSNEIIEALKELRKGEFAKDTYNKLSAEDKAIVEDLNREIKSNVEDLYFNILYAISTTDIETVKLFLDMRFSTFRSKICEINSIDDDKKVIISDYIRNGKRIDKNGRVEKLTGQQKLDIINLVKAYEGSIEEFEKYKIPQKDGKTFILNIKQLQKDIFAKIMEKQGMTKEEIANINLDELSWDMRYISLLTRTPMRDTGELATVIKESSKGTFRDFITDPSNEHGAANLRTKQKFVELGLDYEKWQTGPEEQTISVGGNNYKIKLWNRNPQESLFDGSYTTCCTALDGSNGGSMANYMLNTAINVVEIKDSKGQTIAMSRCYMGKIGGKNTLVIENIEENNKYIAEMQRQGVITDFANGIFEYMKAFADLVGGNGTPIYMSTSYHKIGDEPFEQFAKEVVPVTLIGNISKSEIYLNTYHGYVSTDQLENKPAEFHIIRR